MELTVEVLRACPKLTKLLDFPTGCLLYPILIEEINKHRSLTSINMLLLDCLTQLPQAIIEASPTVGLLRKFRCSLNYSPRFPLNPFFETVLEQGLHIKRLSVSISKDDEKTNWIHLPHFAGVEEIVFYIADDAPFAVRIVSALREHPSLSRIVLREMRLSTIYRLCGQDVPSFVSAGLSDFPVNAHFVCPASDSKGTVLRCRSLYARGLSPGLSDTTYLSTIIDSLATAFPLLEELHLRFATNAPFPINLVSETYREFFDIY